MGVYVLGVPIIRAIVFWGVYQGLMFRETTIYACIRIHGSYLRYLSPKSP